MNEHSIQYLVDNGVRVSAEPLARSLSSAPAPVSELLKRINGLLLFGGAIVFRPASTYDRLHGVPEWNAPDLWKRDYDVDLGPCTFFAEDVFGCQIGWLPDAGIVLLDPETGELDVIASSLDGLVEWIRADPEQTSGSPFLREWEQRNGKLQLGDRLLPTVPFVCGGDFDPSNLVAVHDWDAMRFRGALARQIRHVPDGSTVLLRLCHGGYKPFAVPQ
jgi:hypothetical protein